MASLASRMVSWPKGKSMQRATYTLLCADNSYYVGHTQDINQRLATHNAGKGTHYTANRRPVKLAYAEAQPSKAKAIAREIQLQF